MLFRLLQLFITVLLVAPLRGSLAVPMQMTSDDTEAPPVKKTFQSTNLADVGLSFVSDSGVCETTPGVHQMSGYITVGDNMSMVSPFSVLPGMNHNIKSFALSGFGFSKLESHQRPLHLLYGA